MDEQELSRRFPEGGEECLTAAVARYGQPLLRYCHHVLCDYHEAQDAVQNTFLRAWDRRAQFQAGSNLSAWLYKLAYHACVDGLRARRRQLFASPPPERGTDYIGPELRAALEGLSPQERGLVFSRVMEGMCYEELSEVYGASPAALRKRYERAKKKLARSLAGAKRSEERRVGKECRSR